nr:hypothetical protein [Pyrinomonadaceae bacterium]
KATAADQKATREDRPQAQFQRQKRPLDPPKTSQKRVFTGISRKLAKNSQESDRKSDEEDHSINRPSILVLVYTPRNVECMFTIRHFILLLRRDA